MNKSQDIESFSFIFSIVCVFNNYEVQAWHQKRVSRVLNLQRSVQAEYFNYKRDRNLHCISIYPQKICMINQDVLIVIIKICVSK